MKMQSSEERGGIRGILDHSMNRKIIELLTPTYILWPPLREKSFPPQNEPLPQEAHKKSLHSALQAQTSMKELAEQKKSG